MTPVPAKSILSPCRKFEARLSPSRGSVWDLSHASLTLHDRSFGSRTFGWHGVWSSCSRYFAVSEWIRVDGDRCPDMQLLIVDVREGKECVVERVGCGFVEPMSIQDDRIKYTKIAEDMDERIAVHHPIAELTGWRPLASGEDAASL